MAGMDWGHLGERPATGLKQEAEDNKMTKITENQLQLKSRINKQQNNDKSNKDNVIKSYKSMSTYI